METEYLKALQAIEKALQEPAPVLIYAQFLSSLLAAFIAAVAAIAASWATVFFTNRKVKQNVVVCLFHDVSHISGLIEKALKPSRFDYVDIPELTPFNRMLTIYSTVGGHVGVLDAKSIPEIMGFYFSLQSLGHESLQNGGRRYKKIELENLLVLSRRVLDLMKKTYPTFVMEE